MTDSQGLVQGYQRHVEGQRGGVLGWRGQLQTRYYQEWAALRHVCSRREGQVTITKVPAHSGIHGNEVTDRLAKGGTLSASPELAPVLVGEVIPWVPQHKGLVIEGQLQHYLRMQSLFRHGAHWSRLGRFAARQLQLFEVDWWATFRSLHSRVWPGSVVTSGAASRARAYRIKLLHGSLLTAVRMKTLYPWLYADDVCRRCRVGGEDSTHIWQCTVAAGVLQQLRVVAAQALGVEEWALPASGYGGGKTSSVAWFLHAGWRVLCGGAPQRGKPGGWQLGLVVTCCRQGTERCGCRVVWRLQIGRGEWVSAQLTSAHTGVGSQRMQEGLRGPCSQGAEGWVGRPTIPLREGWCSWASETG